MKNIEIAKAAIIKELIKMEEDNDISEKLIKESFYWIKRTFKIHPNIFRETGIKWYDATIIGAYTGFVAKSLNHYLRKKDKNIEYCSPIFDLFDKSDFENNQFNYNDYYNLISRTLSLSLNKLKSLNNETVYRVESTVNINDRCDWFHNNIGNYLNYNFFVSTSQKKILKEDKLHFIIKSKNNNSGLKNLVPIMEFIDNKRNDIEMEALFQINSCFQITSANDCVISLQEVDKPINNEVITTYNYYWENSGLDL